MALKIQKAERSQKKAKIAVEGVSGSGKTYSSLLLGSGLGDSLCVLDTERGSASMYAGRIAEFDIATLDNHRPEDYISAIREIEKTGKYDVLIIDSISHEWKKVLEIHEKLGGDFRDWGKVNPSHYALFENIIASPLHIICTVRSKQGYAMEPDASGRMRIRKMGLDAIQRNDTEYEFDIVFKIDDGHIATVSKDRTGTLDGLCETITAEHGTAIKTYFQGGSAEPVATESQKKRIGSLWSKLGRSEGDLVPAIEERFNKKASCLTVVEASVFIKELEQEER